MIGLIIIKDNGFAFIHDNSNPSIPCTEFGVYDLGLSLLGWVTPTQEIINDIIYDVAK